MKFVATTSMPISENEGDMISRVVRSQFRHVIDCDFAMRKRREGDFVFDYDFDKPIMGRDGNRNQVTCRGFAISIYKYAGKYEDGKSGTAFEVHFWFKGSMKKYRFRHDIELYPVTHCVCGEDPMLFIDFTKNFQYLRGIR